MHQRYLCASLPYHIAMGHAMSIARETTAVSSITIASKLAPLDNLLKHMFYQNYLLHYFRQWGSPSLFFPCIWILDKYSFNHMPLQISFETWMKVVSKIFSNILFWSRAHIFGLLKNFSNIWLYKMSSMIYTRVIYRVIKRSGDGLIFVLFTDLEDYTLAIKF